MVQRLRAGDRGDGGGQRPEPLRGGMLTKIEAGKIATTAGTHMVIASGRVANLPARLPAALPAPGF